MPDPNAKLVKELQDLTRALEANTKELKEANRLNKRKPHPTAFVTYQEGEEYVDPAAVHGTINPATGRGSDGTGIPPS